MVSASRPLRSTVLVGWVDTWKFHLYNCLALFSPKKMKVPDLINITNLILCLIACVILCPWTRALEAGIPAPEVLHPTLGANPVQEIEIWLGYSRALTNRSSAWVGHQTSGP